MPCFVNTLLKNYIFVLYRRDFLTNYTFQNKETTQLNNYIKKGVHANHLTIIQMVRKLTFDNR